MAALALEAVQVRTVQGGALPRKLVGKLQRRERQRPFAGHRGCGTVDTGRLAHAGFVERPMKVRQPALALHWAHDLCARG